MKLNREEFPELLHSALRKLCDSDATTIAWNIICILPPPKWFVYLDWVYSKLESGSTLKDASLSWRGWDYKAPSENYSSKVLMTAFKLFTDRDWEMYGAYLKEEDEP